MSDYAFIIGARSKTTPTDMHVYPERVCLEGLEMEIFNLVSCSATPEQWKEWLRVPLEHAAARGNLDLFNKLLGAGADGRDGWRGCEGRSLLDAAAVGGNEDVVSGLLRVGAQPDVKVVSCASKKSALNIATMLGHEAVARCLIFAGADVNFHDPVDQMTILHKATWGGHEQLVADLLLTGANPDCRDGKYGASPLHYAVGEGFDGIVSTLLLRGADKDALDHAGETPLMWASQHGRPSVVKTLLAAGADASVRDSKHFSALDLAAGTGHGHVVEAIIRHGVDVNARDDNGFTALHRAAQYDQANAANALIEAGGEIELKKNDGFTPFATAAYHSSCTAMLALFQHGAKIEARDYVGETPLHLACYRHGEGVEAAVDMLLRWGADETALNIDDENPAKLLHKEVVFVDGSARQDEIERARLLLSRAPADRAWRRRGWLVMLRSRDWKAKARESSSDSHGAGGEGGGSEMARSERIADDEDDGPGKTGECVDVQAEGGEGVLGSAKGRLGLEMEGDTRTVSIDGRDVGGEGRDERLRLEALPLLGLGLEGVFRSVVGFL